MKNKIKKILAVLLMVCLVVPSIPSRVAKATESNSELAMEQFIINTGYNVNTGNALDPVKGRMGAEAYLFHTKFQTVSATMESFDANNNPYMRVGYEGWGSNAEQYYVGLYKEDSATWKIKFYRGTNWWAERLISEYTLSAEQIGQLTGDGLDFYLVNSATTNFTVYVEREGVVEMAGDLASPLNNKQVYKVGHSSKDASASFVTTGYFYGTGYTRATAAQELLNQQITDSTGQTYEEFVAHTGYNTNTGTTLDAIKSRMGTETYLFHTKFQTVSATMESFDSSNNPYMRVAYEGWGTNAEQYYVGLYKEDNATWKIKLYRGTSWWAEHLISEYALSEEQIGQLTGNGLDFYLVNSATTNFTVYVESEGVVEIAGNLVSPLNNKQVYKVGHSSKDTSASFITTGYFYGTGYTRATAAQELLQTIVTPTIENEENLTVTGLKDAYTLGEIVEFSISHKAGYVDIVSEAGETLTPNAEGRYQFLVKMEHVDNCNIVISSLAPTFTCLEDTSSGHVTLIGSGTKKDFGNVGNNFLFHTKIKCEKLVNQQGEIQYPTVETTYAQVQYGGWASNTYPWNSYNIQLVLDSTSAKLKFVGDDNWNTTPITLDESQIKKIANNGLDIYFVHSSNATKVFEMYVEQGQTENVYATSVRLNSSTRGNTTIYQMKHSSLQDGVAIVTTGYAYTDYATTKIAAETFSELVAKDIPIQVSTGEYVSLDNLNKSCHVGDYLTFAPATEAGYAVTSLTVNGTKLSPDANGMYHYAVTLEHMDGVTVEVEASKAFESFVTLTGEASNQHGDKLDKYIYHMKVQGDLSVTGEQYVNVNFYTWGENVGDSVCVRINANNDGTATVLLGKYYSGSDGGWGQVTYKLDAKQVKKIKGSGLNLYLVHEGTDSKTFDVYVEDANSASVLKILTIDAYHGDHVYKVVQTKKDGATVTTIGYQYADFLNSTTAPTELFWVEQNANTGDVNDDGKVSVADLIRAKKYANNVTVDSINVRAGDINQNRTLKEDDMNGLRNKVLSNVAEGQYVDYYDGLNSQTSSTNPALNSSLFYNNVRSSSTVYGADPSVMEITKSGDKNQGKYIMMVTGNSNNQSIPVYLGSDLVNWKNIGTITIVNENGESAAEVVTSDIWAMEMVYDDTTGKYYLFFSATPTTENSKIKEVPYVAVGDSYTGSFKLINHSSYKYADNTDLTSKNGTDALGYASYLKYSAFDPYQMGVALKRVGLVTNASTKPFQAIDLHPFVASNGEKYLYFSITSATSGQVILGIKMTNWETPNYDTLTVLTKNYYSQVSGGSYLSYERAETNEGPWMTEHNGKYYLTCSINGYQYDNYKIIQAVADSPLGAFRKLTVEEGGILLGADRIGEISGPGHHSLIEKNGEFYIVYHVHDDPENPNYQRHIVMNKVEWVTNPNGLEVMYVNGPTLASAQPLPAFACGYKNVAALDSTTITATNAKDENSISRLKDKVWNSKGSTWSSGTSNRSDTVFGSTVAKDVEFNGETTITMNFAEAKTIRALMIYNSSDITKAFDEIERIEIVCADGSKKYINHLGFDFVANTYTLAAYQGVTTGDDKFISGASIAEFNEMKVKEIRITVKPGAGKSSVALGEIVVLGKN